MRAFMFMAASLGLGLLIATFDVAAIAQVPGGPTGWGWCAICGKDVYLPTHSHAGSRPPPPPPPNTYSVVRLRNKTSQAVTYQLCATYDWAWNTFTIEPGKWRYHWYGPSSRFSVVFTSGGKRYQYGIDGNLLRGRRPTADDGRNYDFVPVGSGFDLRTGSDLPYASVPTPVTPPARTAADLEWEATVLRQRAEAAEIMRKAEERRQQLARLQDQFAQALAQGEREFTVKEYAKAVESFERAIAVARSDTQALASFNLTWCQKRIAEACAMQARQAVTQGDWPRAQSLFDKAIEMSPEIAQRQEWQNELAAARRLRELVETFNHAVDLGNAAMGRRDYAGAARHFETALRHQPNDRSTQLALASALAKAREQAEEEMRARLAAIAERGPAVPSPETVIPVVPPVESLPASDQTQATPVNRLLEELLLDLREQFVADLERQAMPNGVKGKLVVPTTSDLSALLEDESAALLATRPLDDPALAAMLGGAETMLQELLAREQRLLPPDQTTLLILDEVGARRRVNDYYLACVDEAWRLSSVEFAAEMRRLEDVGLMPRHAPFLEKLKDDPALAAAVRDSGERVMTRFVERKRDALCEAEELLRQVAVERDTDPVVARRIVDVQTRLAWEASQEFAAARRHADQESLAAIRRLTESGLVRVNTPLRVQAESDPIAREALSRYVAPIETRLVAEQQRIRREHQQRLDAEIGAVKGAALPSPGTRP